MNNRQVPTNTILPHLTYQNVAEALDGIASRFGFVEQYRYGSPSDPQGAQMHLGQAWIIVERARRTDPSACPKPAGQYLTIIVNDIDSHYRHARDTGQRSLRTSTKRSTANDNTASKISAATAGSSRSTSATPTPPSGAPSSLDAEWSGHAGDAVDAVVGEDRASINL